MADTNVRIKLTADSSQVKSEISTIDRALKGLGDEFDRVPNPNDSTSPIPRDDGDMSSSDKTRQNTRDRNQNLLLRELIQLRKELQQLNQHYSHPSSDQSNAPTPPPKSTPPASPTPTPGSSSGTPNQNPNPPAPSGGTPSNQNTPSSGINLQGILSKLIMAGSVFSVFNDMAKLDYQRQVSANKTYGSLMTDSSYSDAAKRATDWGKRLGYDWETTLPAIRDNQQQAGFAGLGAQKRDMQAILGASRAYGFDPSQLASSSGRMVGTGTFRIGEQQKFANMLATSIKENGMQGREEQQLNVLESINSNLASRQTNVTAETMASGMNLYNAIAALHPSMTGERGANLANRMIDIANQGDDALDIYAGLGTQYTGVKGYLDLRRLAADNPQQYYAQAYASMKAQMGDGQEGGWGARDAFLMKLVKGEGMGIRQAEAMIDAIESGHEFDTKAFTEEGQDQGQAEINQRTEHYQESTLQKLDEFNINWRESQAEIGGKINEVKAQLFDIFNSMPQAAQVGIVAASGLVSAGLLGKIATSIVTGRGLGGVGTGAAGAGGASGGGAGSGAGAGASRLSRVGKVAGKLATPLTIAAGTYDAYQHVQAGDYQGAAGDVGGVAGALALGKAGAAGGAALGTFIGGPIGTAVGGVVGGIAGGVAGYFGGSELGKSTYDFIFGEDTPSVPRENTLGDARTAGGGGGTFGDNTDVSALLGNAGDALLGVKTAHAATPESDDIKARSERSLRLTEDNTRATIDNTDALNTQIKRLGGGEGGANAVDGMFMQRQQEQAMLKQQQQWTEFFKNLTNQINNTLSRVGGKGGTGSGSHGGGGGTFGGGGSNKPLSGNTGGTPTGNLGAVDDVDLDALMSDIEGGDVDLPGLPLGKVALAQSLYYKKEKGIDIDPAVLYGQMTHEGGWDNITAEASGTDRGWRRDYKNVWGNHYWDWMSKNGTKEMPGGVGATTGLGFIANDTWREAFDNDYRYFLNRENYKNGQIATPQDFAGRLNDNGYFGSGDANAYASGLSSGYNAFNQFRASGDWNQYIGKYKPTARSGGGAPTTSPGNLRIQEERQNAGRPHGHGLKYVASDDYPALLHTGERVLTRQENKEFNNISALNVPEKFRITDDDSLSDSYYKHQAQEQLQQKAAQTQTQLEFTSRFIHDLFSGAPLMATGGNVSGNSVAQLMERRLNSQLTESNYKELFPNAISLSQAIMMQNRAKQVNGYRNQISDNGGSTVQNGTIRTSGTIKGVLSGGTPATSEQMGRVPTIPTTTNEPPSTTTKPIEQPAKPISSSSFTFSTPSLGTSKYQGGWAANALPIPDLLDYPGDVHLSRDEAAKAKDPDAKYAPSYNLIDHGTGAENPGDTVSVINAKYNAQRRNMYARLRNQRDGVGSGHEFDKFKLFPGLDSGSGTTPTTSTEPSIASQTTSPSTPAKTKKEHHGYLNRLLGRATPYPKEQPKNTTNPNIFAQAAMDGVFSTMPNGNRIPLTVGGGFGGGLNIPTQQDGNGNVSIIPGAVGGMGGNVSRQQQTTPINQGGYNGVPDLPPRMMGGQGGGFNLFSLPGLNKIPGMEKLQRMSQLKGVGGSTPFGGGGGLFGGLFGGAGVGGSQGGGGSFAGQIGNVLGMALGGALYPGGTNRVNQNNRVPLAVGGGFGGGLQQGQTGGTTSQPKEHHGFINRLLGRATPYSKEQKEQRREDENVNYHGLRGLMRKWRGKDPNGADKQETEKPTPKPEENVEATPKPNEPETDELGNIKGYNGLKDNMVVQGDLSPIRDAKIAQQRKDMGLSETQKDNDENTESNVTNPNEPEKDTKNHHGLRGLMRKWRGKDPNGNQQDAVPKDENADQPPPPKDEANGDSNSEPTPDDSTGENAEPIGENSKKEHHGYLNRILGRATPYDKAKDGASGQGQGIAKPSMPGSSLTKIGGQMTMVRAGISLLGGLGLFGKNRKGKANKLGTKLMQMGAIGSMVGGIMNIGASQAPGGQGGLPKMGNSTGDPNLNKDDPMDGLNNENSPLGGVTQQNTQPSGGAPAGAPQSPLNNPNSEGSSGEGGTRRIEVVVSGKIDGLTPENNNLVAKSIANAFTRNQNF